MTTLIENAVIIPMTERNRFMKGSILIKDGIIMEAGNIAEAEADETIDADGMIALPSFVNAHTHLAMVLMRNYKDTCENLQDWLSEIFPIEDKLDDEDIYQASRLGAAELIQSGCTVFADMYFRAWNTVKAVKEAGCRAIIGQTFMNDAADARFRINEIAPRILEEIGDDDMFRLDAAVHAVYTSTPDCYECAAEWTASRGARLHTHLSETRKEVDDCLKQYGRTPVELLDSIGIFQVPVYAAHGVHISSSEMEALRRGNAAIVHNPASNMKLASGYAPVQKMLDAGVNLSIGTDGMASNNTHNILQSAYLLACCQKGYNLDPTVVPAKDIVKMMTVNGAKAQGRLDCGVIAEGKKADLVVMDIDTPWMKPVYDMAVNLVYSANGADVCLTMCDGKVLYRDGEFLTIDVEKAAAECQRSIDEILAALQAGDE